jgi:hypothetical protein
MMSLRGGFTGRCCITEVADVTEWTNMPFGRVTDTNPKIQGGNTNQQQVVSDSDADQENDDDNSVDSNDEKT